MSAADDVRRFAGDLQGVERDDTFKIAMLSAVRQGDVATLDIIADDAS